MAARLKTEDGITAYRQRGHIAETPHGHIKHNMGFRQLSLRGTGKVTAEWNLTAAVHNLFKAITAGHLAARGTHHLTPTGEPTPARPAKPATPASHTRQASSQFRNSPSRDTREATVRPASPGLSQDIQGRVQRPGRWSRSSQIGGRRQPRGGRGGRGLASPDAAGTSRSSSSGSAVSRSQVISEKYTTGMKQMPGTAHSTTAASS